MITVDCPFCAGDAHLEDGLAVMSCDGCGVTVDVAPEPIVPFEAAA
jgi:hypothetical protein